MSRPGDRLKAAQHGNFGDWKPIGEDVSEMRINIGPGYRIYFLRRGEAVYLLLAGGEEAPRARDRDSRMRDQSEP
jgi:putative addiction module killer protein